MRRIASNLPGYGTDIHMAAVKCIFLVQTHILNGGDERARLTSSDEARWCYKVTGSWGTQYTAVSHNCTGTIFIANNFFS